MGRRKGYVKDALGTAKARRTKHKNGIERLNQEIAKRNAIIAELDKEIAKLEKDEK